VWILDCSRQCSRQCSMHRYSEDTHDV
jgi:hypothetical protein